MARRAGLPLTGVESAANAANEFDSTNNVKVVVFIGVLGADNGDAPIATDAADAILRA